jgi:monofunctional biosynthetic peptidoglycan transglycosylase
MRRRSPKILPRFLLTILIAGLSMAGVALWLPLPDVTPLADRKTTRTIQVRDWQGKERPFLLGPKNPYWRPLAAIPETLRWAVIVAEDASFFDHEGIDFHEVKEAVKYDLRHRRFAHGASTITQQLAKNVFLSREKNLVRKAKELLLARRIEEKLTKKRILELYLNLVELGPMVYGVGHGARYHFGKPVQDLTPAECATLAAILPGPRVAYNPSVNPARVRHRAARILRLLRGRRVLTTAQYVEALARLQGRPAETGAPSTDETGDNRLEAPDVSSEPGS